MYAVLMYLDDDFEGGHTTFLAQQPDAFRIDLPSSDHPGGTAMDKRVHASVQPRTGSVLAFNHDVLREGTPVGKHGKKYQLRAEVMFSRVDALSGRHRRDAFECRGLYMKAALHESNGDATKFCSTYLRALELRFKASRSIVPQKPPRAHRAVAPRMRRPLLALLHCVD